MARAGKVPGLTAETGVADGIRLVVTARLREFRVLRDAAPGCIEPEGLHDLRIACRRLSWALREFSQYIPTRHLAPPRQRLKRIAAALGGVREEDAAIAELEKLAGESPAEVSAGVEMLAAEHSRQRSRLLAALAKQLRAGSLNRLEAELSRALGHVDESSRRYAPAERGEGGGSSGFSELGRKLMREHLSEMEERGEGFFRPDNRKSLRRMRRAVRELRFCLESLESYGDGRADAFDDELGRLQTALGKIHDRDAWIEEVGARLLGLNVRSRSGAGSCSKWDAAVWLLTHYTASRAEHFCEALTTWNELRERGLSERLTSYVKADVPADGRRRLRARA